MESLRQFFLGKARRFAQGNQLSTEVICGGECLIFFSDCWIFQSLFLKAGQCWTCHLLISFISLHALEQLPYVCFGQRLGHFGDNDCEGNRGKAGNG